MCVIGAGSSGIASCQVLQTRGIPFACFEKGSEVGGNWRYMNDNEVSSAYRSLHINTSRNLMAYATYPMPEDCADYPDHFAIARYRRRLRRPLRFPRSHSFRTEVVRVGAAQRGGYDVTTRAVESGEERTSHHAAVMVANGHHWDPRWPEPPFVRPARSRSQAARGPPDAVLRPAAARRPRRCRREAEHRALRRRPARSLRGRQRGGDRPRRVLHRLQDQLPPLPPDIARERRAGARRRRPVLGTVARRSHELRVGSLSS